MRSRRFRRRKGTAYWEVWQVCGFCRERRTIATFNEKREAVAYVRARPKKARISYLLERGF
jgi:hypothetical protein